MTAALHFDPLTPDPLTPVSLSLRALCASVITPLKIHHLLPLTSHLSLITYYLSPGTTVVPIANSRLALAKRSRYLLRKSST